MISKNHFQGLGVGRNQSFAAQKCHNVLEVSNPFINEHKRLSFQIIHYKYKVLKTNE